MIRADLSDLQHRFAARRTGMSRMEYAACIQRYRRPTSAATKLGYVFAAALTLGAILIGASA
jgi:hypothetical protein